MPTEENVSNIRLSILTANSISKAFLDFIYIYMMMMIMMMNCFCGMVDWQKPYFQPGPLSEIFTIWISDKPQAGFEPAQNLSSGLVELSCAVSEFSLKYWKKKLALQMVLFTSIFQIPVTFSSTKIINIILIKP